jgi:hypothetical protein
MTAMAVVNKFPGIGMLHLWFDDAYGFQANEKYFGTLLSKIGFLMSQAVSC